MIRPADLVVGARFLAALPRFLRTPLTSEHACGVLRERVHPDVGSLDAAAVERTFLAALSNGSGPERVMGLAGRDAGLVRVEARAPLTTASGKVLHLHVGRARASRAADRGSARRASESPE